MNLPIRTAEADSAKVVQTVSRFNPKTFAASPIITLTIGPDKKKYFVHKALLTTYSPYFEACLKPAFSEGQDNEVVFPEDPDVAFEGLIAWLYSGSLSDELFAYKASITLLGLQMYKLADKLMIPELQDLILRKIRQILRASDFCPVPNIIVAASDAGIIGTKFGEFLVKDLTYKLAMFPQDFDVKADDDDSKRRVAGLEQIYENHDAATALLKSMILWQSAKWVSFEDEDD